MLCGHPDSQRDKRWDQWFNSTSQHQLPCQSGRPVKGAKTAIGYARYELKAVQLTIVALSRVMHLGRQVDCLSTEASSILVRGAGAATYADELEEHGVPPERLMIKRHQPVPARALRNGCER